MVEKFNVHDKKKHPALLDFIQNHQDEDFYLTENNDRVYINDFVSLKKLFKNSKDVYVFEEAGDYQALCLSWKSIGGEKIRHYIKLLAVDSNAASDVLRCFLWHTCDELFVKINKKHVFLDVFKKYGFKFIGGRGKQILLKRDKFVRKIEHDSFAMEGKDSDSDNE